MGTSESIGRRQNKSPVSSSHRAFCFQGASLNVAEAPITIPIGNRFELDCRLHLVQSGEEFTTLMNSPKTTKSGSRRLTISLGEGQRRDLEAIAETNHTSLAFVIRHALNHFILEHKDKQLHLNLLHLNLPS